jgi:hypothetical protein
MFLTLDNSLSPTKSWYQQFWPWFLIAVPLSAVIGGLVTLIIAITHTDALVVDDYYKQGLAINRVLARDHQATELGITALVRFDLDGGKIHLQLEDKSSALKFDSPLRLQLLHSTRADLDIETTLKSHDHGTYLGDIPPLITGKWHLLIEPESRAWRLTTRVELPRETSVRLGQPR